MFPGDIKIDDSFKIKNISANVGSNKVIVNLKLPDEQDKCVLLVTACDGGKMLDFKAEKGIRNGYNEVDITLPLNADKVKVMLWGSLESMTPLCQCEEIAL
jgi:hypothetical protein